jgi:hypothetical protein
MQALQSLISKSYSDMEVGDIIPAVAAATFTARVAEILSVTGKPGARLAIENHDVVTAEKTSLQKGM